ncbi:MAG: TetR family transcriptional regulator [Verrucomicrobia bacterium]|nr:TetR family transcriptional regulator [Verrucomicrobiota bacterium]
MRELVLFVATRVSEIAKAAGVADGTIYLYWGTATQTLDASGEALLAAGGHPPYRRQAVAVGKKFLCGRERTSLPNLEFVGFRFPRQSVLYTIGVASGSLVVGLWYEVRGSGSITHASATLGTGALFQATATTWATASGAPTVHETGLDRDWQANPFAVLAEYLTDEAFGLGLPPSALVTASWSAAAAAARARSGSLYISPLLTKAEDSRAFVQRVLDHVDGWSRWTADGKIEAGLWAHAESPPAWTSANTVDYHDLVEPADLDPTSWQETTNVTVVTYSDRARSYKARPARVSNAWNRQSTGGLPRIRTLDRPYILRADQALAVAAEDAKLSGQPYHEGNLVVRAEKAEGILPGSLFRLTHDSIGLSIACRCVGKSLPAPPSGTVTLRYQTERGLSAIPYVATTPQGVADAPLPPARITDLEVLQIPPSLGDGSDFSLVVLAGRADPLTSRFDLWFRQADATDFYPLAGIPNFAVAGVVDATFAPFEDLNGDPIDDDAAEAVRVAITAGTPALDLDRVDDVQTDDAIEDAAFLLFLVRASDPTQYEILTIKSATLVSGRTFDLVVRRARYGTQQGGDGAYSFAAGDRAWLIYRRLLVPIGSEHFAALATAGETAHFRIVPATAYQTADVADVYDAGTNPGGLTTELDFDFADPFAPTIEWTAIQQRPDPLTAWADITDFDVDFDPSTEFRLVANLRDATGDLATADLQATAGNLSRTIFAGAVSGAYGEVETVFTLPEGDWDLAMKATDASGRVTAAALTPVGGGAAVALRVRPSGWGVCANPVIRVTSTSGGKPLIRNVTLSCSTAGATIYYQITNWGGSPGPTWTNFAGGTFIVAGSKRLHAYAAAAGLVDSAVVRRDF